MTRFTTGHDLGMEDFPERGDIAAWLQGDSDRPLPDYVCSNCGLLAGIPSDCSPYCKRCGSMMVNYKPVCMIMEAAFEAYKQEDGKEGQA